ncbi:aquaporin AQPcic-like isoform X2 [Zophobas morio]|uniref:aquaporin AQPcic-like isoform X2 n=1 Tax=Zophobas morio TaxID=2755281 RepID=UPI003082D724
MYPRDSSIQLPQDSDVTYKKGNTSAWLNGLTIATAEFIGTALLVFLTCMGCTKEMFGEIIPVAQTSLASGLSVMTAIQIFGHISGAHVNPAITLCAVIMGEISLTSVPIYVSSQIAGSLTGYALLTAVTPDKYLDTAGHCATAPHMEISLIQACVVEFLATFIMALAICASWDPKNSSKGDSVPIRIGLIVFLLNISAGAYTGASMNPARSLGPIVWNHYRWYTHWVYWVGPVLGAVLAGHFYKKVFLKQRN